MNIEQKVNAIMRYIVAERQEEKEKAAEEIKAMIEPAENGNQAKNIEDLISEILVELGMPCHIKGYRYSAYAIKLATENSNILDSVTGVFYPSVAEHYGTTASRVSRGIRHSIEVCWDRIDFNMMEKYFGNTVSPEKGKPTNAEFIACISNIVRRRIRNGEE